MRRVTCLGMMQTYVFTFGSFGEIDFRDAVGFAGNPQFVAILRQRECIDRVINVGMFHRGRVRPKRLLEREDARNDHRDTHHFAKIIHGDPTPAKCGR